MKTTKNQTKQSKTNVTVLAKTKLRNQFQNRLFRFLFFSLLFSIGSNLCWAQFSLVGDAISQGNICYRLTPDAQGKVGAIWNQSKITLDSDFVIEGTMNFGTNDGNGADGIAFVFQPICSGLGSAGGGIGFYGVNPSLAVEFDTWQNGAGELNDPAADHIALIKNGNLNHSSAGNLYGPISLSNLEDGNSHSFKIEWMAGLQTLEVTLDNVKHISYSLDAVHDIFGDNPNVYWGFTAATGSYANSQTVCITSSSFTEQGSYKVTHASCPNYNNGSIDLDVSGMVQPVTFLWNTNATSEDLQNLQAGTYSVTLTDSNSCLSRLSIDVLDAPDTEAPFITCASNKSVSGSSYTVSGVELDPPSFGDLCSGINLKNNYNNDTTLAGATFSGGTTMVIWNLSDVANNLNSCTLTVIVTPSSCGAGLPIGANVKNGNVVIKTQTQMNAFFNNTAGAQFGNKYTKIAGTLTLDGSSSTDPITNFCNLSELTEITHSLEILNFNKSGNPTNLNALAKLEKIGCWLLATGNSRLLDLSLPELVSVGCSFKLENNANTTAIVMPKLASVQGDKLTIKNHPKLESLSLSSTANSFNFTGRGSNVEISDNGNSAAGNLTMNLKKINTIKGALIFDNNDNAGVSNFDAIFTGLSSLPGNWGKLSITNNDYLSICCIAASVTVGGAGNRHIISGNTGNCLDSATVLANCGVFHKKSNLANSSSINKEADAIYPNPNTGNFKVSLPVNSSGELQIWVFDLMGRTVYSERLTVNGTEHAYLSIPNLPSGQYLLKTLLNNALETNRLVITR